MRLYHTGFFVIKNPDIYYGKKNADFGQGFYLSDDEEFSHRWAKSRIGQSTYVNVYELDMTGLKVMHLKRDAEWFNYIFNNRRGKADAWAEYDVIIGPIANDTIYDVMGITTSGYLDDDEAIQLLQIGPEYKQITIKSERAVKQLTWIEAEALDFESLKMYRETVVEEEERFQARFSEILSQFT